MGLFDVFGTDPLPWHVVGAALLVGMGTTLYLVLRELLLSRPMAVAVRSSTRSCPIRNGAILAGNVCGAPEHAAPLREPLRRLARGAGAKLRLSAWILLATATLTISVLAYEVAMPLFPLAPVLVLYRRAKVGGPSLRRCSAVSTPYALALLAVFAWKAAEARDIGKVTGYELGYPDGFAHHLAYLGQGILRVNAGSYGLGFRTS